MCSAENDFFLEFLPCLQYVIDVEKLKQGSPALFVIMEFFLTNAIK